MKNKKWLSRLGGLATAAVMLFSQTAGLSGSAAKMAATDLSETCNYSKEVSIVLKRGEPVDVKPGDYGVLPTEVVSQIWIDLSTDVSSGKPIMPAYGYTATGYENAELEQKDWYGTGDWVSEPTEKMTFCWDTLKDYPIPGVFQLQLWGEEGAVIDTATVTRIGFKVKGGGSIGVATRPGDVNNDRQVTIADVILLVKYLTAETDTLNAPANADLDKNNRLDAVDLTLLKRGLMDGSLEVHTNPTDETAMEFVSHLKLGWNLGNTLDSQGYYSKQNQSPSTYEESWGNPTTTKGMIDTIKAAGFNTVRIPVSWGAKMDGNTYQINSSWMDRVQEVVNYVIDNDMYCIVNIHHDNTDFDYNTNTHHFPDFPYFYPDSAHYQQSEKFVTSVWSQVSERFKGYDNHLIFETMNEPRLVGHRNEWWIDSSNSDCQDAMNCINKLNAAALNVIRKSGGNNEKRFVLLPTYAANPDQATLDGCVMPNDSHILAEIHAYRPYSFCLEKGGTANFNVNSDGGEIVTMMNSLKNKFINNGIPVVIDEFGAMNRNNEDARATWVKFYVETANSFGIPCVWWDNNAFSGDGENFGLLDRNANQIRYPKIMSAMVEASKNRG